MPPPPTTTMARLFSIRFLAPAAMAAAMTTMTMATKTSGR
jgi:hypothetical protein